MYKQFISECLEGSRKGFLLVRKLKNMKRGIDCCSSRKEISSRFYSTTGRNEEEVVVGLKSVSSPSSFKQSLTVDVKNELKVPNNKELKQNSLEENAKQTFIERKGEDITIVKRKRHGADFKDLLASNQFQKIKTYNGKSKDEDLIQEYLRFLKTYPSIRDLNNRLDVLAKREQHYLSEPIFKQLLYFLTHTDLEYLGSKNIHILKPNYHTFNMIMMSYLTVGDIPTVRSLFESIPIWTGDKPSYVNFVTLLTAYCRVGDWKTLNELFIDFIDEKLQLKEGLHKEAVTGSFTVVMKSLVDMGSLSKVEQMYQTFLSKNFKPSPYMINIMLNVYKMRKNFDKCIEMFEECEDNVKSDRYITQTMICVYGEMRKIEEMEKLFSTVKKPNDFTYIIMTGEYCYAGMETKAEEYFSRIVNKDEKIISKMMEMYSRKGNTEKLEQTFSLINKPTVASIYIYIDGISRFGNYERVSEVIKLVPSEKYTGNIWVCHLQSAVKTMFDDPEQYIKRVQSIFFAKPKNISWKENKFGMKLFKLALGKQFSAQKAQSSTSLKPITEIYKEFAEKKVKLARDGVDEGKFQTRDSFHEQFVLNNNSIYRPDYVSPYEAFLEGYYKKDPTSKDE